MAVLRLASERWVADERADIAQVLSSSAADLIAVTTDSIPNVSEASAAGQSSAAISFSDRG
ncbi:hypothetical protein OG203_01675 [Nocardia sp. NBC_01499]|uniref:hypothetical protein n=1 Tax=Nocardia sp. NBC_01499 TaxID=2903597 RepID=UPI0038697DAA